MLRFLPAKDARKQINGEKKKLRYFQAGQVTLWLFWSILKKVPMRLRQTVAVRGHPELFHIIAPKDFCSFDNALFILRPANDWIMMSTHGAEHYKTLSNQ